MKNYLNYKVVHLVEIHKFNTKRLFEMISDCYLCRFKRLLTAMVRCQRRQDEMAV
jgi:hypothetical protein